MSFIINTPGTVSKILWHFTGGPQWDDSTKKQGDKKTPGQSFDILKKILESMMIKLGNYEEIIKIVIDEEIEFKRTGGGAGPKEIISPLKIETIVHKNVSKKIKSVKVCCLADIPLQHLPNHSRRYGKFAIGFHRNSVLKNNFNPVLYTLENENLIKTVMECFESLSYSTEYSKDIEFHLSIAMNELWYIKPEIIKSNMYLLLQPIKEFLESQSHHLNVISHSIKKIISYIKTIEKSELYSIFCEREWRSTKQFEFEYDDIAMIVLPREIEGEKYYEHFVEATEIPRRVPIFPWEDIVEH